MKSLYKILFVATLFFGSMMYAQKTSVETKVNGNCGMCKERIEKTSKSAGASSADWNAETLTLKLEFDQSKTSLDKILKEVAEAGHDNEKYKTSSEVYDSLPGCCHYDRNNVKVSVNDAKSDIQGAKKEFFVKGNCESCKARIESAAKEAGATFADWNAELQKLTMDFDQQKTNADDILKKIAEVGHDNEKYKTTKEVYDALPGCCKYDREEAFPNPGEKADSHLIHHDAASSQREITSENHENVPNDKEKSIEEIKITKAQEATALNKKEAGLVFNINSKELLKAACCNLSESFETNATVDVAFSNAVTGTKQLKMLGLDQKYTALTKELLPEIRGLASAYGLTFIPGRWISGIQLTKGGSTVVNGYESITGQINTEFLKFNKNPETSLNIFADFQGRTEANITSVSKLNDKWSQSILLHGNGTFGNVDNNKDGFLDRPKGNQMNATYILNYSDLDKSGLMTHIGINFLKDNRRAGQTNFDEKRPQISQDKYGVNIDISRFQLWNKTGYIFKGKPYQSIGFMNQFTYHKQNSFFGLRNYFGEQKTYYSNLIFESIFGNTNHKYKTGASFLYDDYNEDYLTQNFQRTETVPGLFFEYTLTGLKYTLVAGLRSDFHNLAGTQISPRLNFKYDFSPKTIVRISAGKGFRTANVFAENQQFFASSRTLEIVNNQGKIYGLKPEIAWNYGVSLQQDFKLFGKKASWVTDFFRTDFQNQVIADLENPRKIVFYNLSGKSFANSLQTQLDFSPAKNLDLRLAYKYYNVEADFASGRKQVPFLAKDRGFFNVAYSTKKENKNAFWTFDTTLQYVGKQRIPNTKSNPQNLQLPDFSNPYFLLNAQIAHNFNKNIRAYFGGENLTNYMQKNPILDAQNPFGNYFDGGMIFAPIMSANLYVGLDVSF